MKNLKDKYLNFANCQRNLSIPYRSKSTRILHYQNLILYRVLHIFSIFDEKSALKGVTFQKLFELCDKNDQIKIIVENLKKIEEISKEWDLSLDERKELYKSCAKTLDKANES